MKKFVVRSAALGVFAVALSGGATAFAAPTPVLNNILDTKGMIEFTADDEETGNLVKPDEKGDPEEVIQIPGGNSGKGALRIQFVPDLNFGTKAGITSDVQTKFAEYLPYKDKDGNDTGKNVPPFVQVTNNTGDSTTPWSLKVRATEFKGIDDNHVLTGAQMTLEGSTLTMTKKDSIEAGKIAKGQTAGIAIPTTGGVEVLASTGDTNGTQISNVFEDGYQKATDYPEGEGTGVKFTKPTGIAAHTELYESTITWTLESGL